MFGIPMLQVTFQLGLICLEHLLPRFSSDLINTALIQLGLFTRLSQGFTQ